MEPAAVPPEVPPVSTPGFSRLRTIAQDPKAVAITHFLIPAAAPFEKVNGARRPMQFIDTLRYLAPDRGATNAGPLPAV